MNLLKTIINRPTIVVVLFTVLLGFGLFSYNRLSQELFPKMEFPVITITTVYSGAGPEEVESSVSKKIEDAVASLENIKNINTSSMEGFSYIVVEFKDGTDINVTAQNAQRKVNAVRSDLPLMVREPSVDIFDMNELPIMNLSATANLDEAQLYDLMKNDIQPLFECIPGVARINLIGGREREVQVNINEQRLAAYDLSIVEVSNILIMSNTDYPTGKINDNGNQVFIRLSAKYQNLKDIENLVVKTFDDGSVVKVSDIAFVSDGEKDVMTIYRYNGVNSIGLSVQKQLDANAMTVSGEVKNQIVQIEEQYKDKGLIFQIPRDSSDFTLAATHSVIEDLLMAILFVAAAMLLFLHSFRNSLIVMIAIPTSLITIFAVMYLTNCTLNLMTLMALSLVIGILVDDAIVIIENIHRHLEMGKTKIQATLDGVKEIAGSVVTLTLVLAVVFVPMAFVEGMAGMFLREFSIVVASATLVSLLISITIIPVLSSRFSTLETISSKNIFGKFVHWFENLINGFSLQMKNLLQWSLSHKLIVFGITTLLFISSIGLVATGFVGTEFISSGDVGEFYVDLKLPKDATVEQTNLVTLQAEELLKQQDLVTSIFSTVGMEENGQAQANKSQISVKMTAYKDRKVTAEDYAHQIKLLLQRYIVDAEVTTMPGSIMGDADEAPIQIFILGNNLDSIFTASGQIAEALRKIQGTSDLQISVEAGNPEITITLNREKMARLSVSQSGLGEALNNSFAGNTDAKFRDNNKEYDIGIRLDASNRKSKADIGNFTIINSAGEEIKLKQIATIAESESPTKLERRNRSNSLTISSQVIGRPSGDVGDDVTAAIKNLNLPSSVQIVYGGDMENQAEGFGSLLTAIVTSLLLVYLILVLLYNSYLYPFAILFSIPLAIIGVFYTLGLTMQAFGFLSLLGIIILIGLVSRNAILVVDFAIQLKNKGVEVKEALLQATQQRFRPILMTTISTVVGMVPIAIAKGSAAEWKNGLGWVLIGGLLSSMFLSLIIVPLVYYLLERMKEKFSKKKKQVVAQE
ncbi:MAG: efflux RND transporter permease subunit [Candidatus Symbiothrix sp.]|jgi:HAE1 family hydrophobic/amphiphilic exporter-1|nr:efflux RND transporter permease subunit [Candidatus Symbiothrix sp.]